MGRIVMVRRATFLMLLAWLGLGLGGVHAAEKPSPEDLRFFETKIRPVLVQHCYACHTADAEELGGKLLLDSRQGMRTGGESGPAVVAGQPDDSPLIHALRYETFEMPPDEPLSEAIVNDFVEWIRRGAPDPRDAQTVAVAERAEGDEAAPEFWSLRPLTDPAPPEVADTAWPRDEIDHFILAEIEAAQLRPAADATPRVLARRLAFDLIGLPLPMERLEAFEQAYQQDSHTAVEHLVDELLASPHFGERWGRHWLDVARYGESNGNDGLGRNPTFPHAWRYRDYVIDAFNEDLPYDAFVREQIAGDLLESDTDELRDRRLVATGFLAIGSKPAKAMNTNFEMDVVADQLDAIGLGMLGLSIGCARCHDHKSDPIPTRDYYALAGILTSTETLWGTAAHEKLTAPVTDLHVLKTPEHAPPPEGWEETVLVKDSATGIPRAYPKPKWPLGTPLAMGVRDVKKPADTKINLRGEAKKLGAEVPRGVLSLWQPADMGEIPADASGRRQLAEWVAHPENPLTARVLVNRVWQHLFAEGLVRTPDEFGAYGDPPTHPELLDHLAGRFVAEGWSIKRLIRAVVLSRTYQQASRADALVHEQDSTNRLFARQSPRRLEAEALRDVMLWASGQLLPERPDGSIIRHRDILVNLAGNLHEPSRHRSVYLCYLRSSPPPELAAFDLPDFTTVLGKRTLSTVPGQALHLFNNPFVIEQATAFGKLALEAEASPTDRVALIFRRALNRDPSPDEQAGALDLVQWTAEETGSELAAWASVCQALLIANEFRYVD